MINASIRFTVSAQYQHQLRDVLATVLGPTRALSGCIACCLYHAKDDPQYWLLLENWDSENEYRFCTEMQSWEDDQSVIKVAHEFRLPVGGSSSLRLRAYFQTAIFDVNGDGKNDTTSRLGDFDIRFLSVVHKSKTVQWNWVLKTTSIARLMMYSAQGKMP